MLICYSTYDKKIKKSNIVKEKYYRKVFLKYAFLPCKMSNGCIIWLEPYFILCNCYKEDNGLYQFDCFIYTRIPEIDEDIKKYKILYSSYSLVIKIPFKKLFKRLKYIKEKYEYFKN